MNKLKLVNSEEKEVDLLLLEWPPGVGQWWQVLPCRASVDGVILAVPKDCMEPPELEEGQRAGPGELVGPSCLVTTTLNDADESLVELLVVEFGMGIRKHLERKGARCKKAFVSFVQEADLLPMIGELDQHVEAWLEGAPLGLEDYQTAPEPPGVEPVREVEEVPQPMDAKDMDRLYVMIAKLESRIDQMQQAPAF